MFDKILHIFQTDLQMFDYSVEDYFQSLNLTLQEKD